jgi:hypothetical protein
VEPAGTLAQVEIFGPVVVLMTFRTPAESVELANNTRYGLAASVWTENLNLALDVAPKIRAGTVWINCTNLFDAASGFGGVSGERIRSGGRPGGTRGLPSAEADRPLDGSSFGGCDRTAPAPRTRADVRPGAGIPGDRAGPGPDAEALHRGEAAAAGRGNEPCHYMY